MPKTVVGLFDTFSEAQSAVQDLVNFGVRREDVSVVARDENGGVSETHDAGASSTAEGAGAGALGGSVVGGALGLLIGAGLLVIPGIGPVLAAGPLAAGIGSAAAAIGATALGAGIGAAACGLLGGLMGAGVPEEDARFYVEGVRRGGTLVSVAASDTEFDDVRQILIRNGAIDMDARSTEWRAAGWDATGADAYAAGNVSMGSAAINSGSDAYTTGTADVHAGGEATMGDVSTTHEGAYTTGAVAGDTSIPRGDSYSIRGQDYSNTGEPGLDTVGAQAGAETDAAGKDWQDSSKLGTVGGSLAGAATGAAIGAVGGPVGAVVGGIAGAATGAGVGAAGDVAGERVEPATGHGDGSDGPGEYRFRDEGTLADRDRKVVDTSFTDVDRTGERVKDPAGFESGHSQSFDSDPAQFDEFASYDQGNFRTDESTTSGPRGAVSPSREPDMGGSLSGDDRPAVDSPIMGGNRPPADSANMGAMLGGNRDMGAGMADLRPHDQGIMGGLHGDTTSVPEADIYPMATDADGDQIRPSDGGVVPAPRPGGDHSSVPDAMSPSPMASDADTASESTRRAPHFAGSDSMGGAISGMRSGSGSEQPGAFSSTPGRQLSSDQRASMEGDERNAGAATSDELSRRRGARIYDSSGHRHDSDTARTGDEGALPAHGDFARGMREETPSEAEPDYARGLHDSEAMNAGAANTHHGDSDAGVPHHGDFARGMREEAEPVQPDFARGQRSYEVYDADFMAHHQSLTGAGGQPYDYYRPGYQFGYDLANDRSYSHDSWDALERDARVSWERNNRNDWAEFRDVIRYGWEKARGRA